jgi:hypothetical protein
MRSRDRPALTDSIDKSELLALGYDTLNYCGRILMPTNPRASDLLSRRLLDDANI